ncbi:MAG: chemotaxis protein CheX [Candidatus Methylacidiphilales bacterium]|nr:chemotaxis protein CheX [Candidatus Methylacidiphilales bacterium]
MTESELQVFIDGTTRYFGRTTRRPAIVDPPFLKGEESFLLDYTGVIGISGKQRGTIYFSATTDMLSELILSMGAGLPYMEDSSLRDMVGEVTNTISGNARKEFGGMFMISVPVVVKGNQAGLYMPSNLTSFVIPVIWGAHKAFLVVCLE